MQKNAKTKIFKNALKAIFRVRIIKNKYTSLLGLFPPVHHFFSFHLSDKIEWLLHDRINI